MCWVPPSATRLFTLRLGCEYSVRSGTVRIAGGPGYASFALGRTGAYLHLHLLLLYVGGESFTVLSQKRLIPRIMPLAFIMAPRLLLVGGEFVDRNEFILIVRNVLPGRD